MCVCSGQYICVLIYINIYIYIYIYRYIHIWVCVLVFDLCEVMIVRVNFLDHRELEAPSLP